MGQAMLVEMLTGVCLFFVILAGATIVFYHSLKEDDEDD